MLKELFKTVSNSVSNFISNFRDDLAVEDEVLKVADLLLLGITVSTADDDVAVYRTDVSEDEGTPGPVWAYAIETISHMGMPIYEEYDNPTDAARRFVGLRAVCTTDGADEPYEDARVALYFYDDEVEVLRQLFASMKLENGKTVAEELLDIDSAPYVVNFESADKNRLNRDEWRELVTKLKSIVA